MTATASSSTPRAFADIAADSRNALIVTEDGGAVVTFPQATYVPDWDGTAPNAPSSKRNASDPTCAARAWAAS